MLLQISQEYIAQLNKPKQIYPLNDKTTDFFKVKEKVERLQLHKEGGGKESHKTWVFQLNCSCGGYFSDTLKSKMHV